MDSKALKRRSWIKNFFIIFLSIMLFLTFFSNTIMNFSLPEVSAQYPSSGSITSRIRKSGTVAATEDYEVILGETRTLLGVEVKKGQMVAIGDLLFKLEAGESKEVENAVKAYEEAKVAYDIAQLDLDKDYTELQNAVNTASNELTKLKNRKNNSGSDDELIKSLQREIKQLEKEIDNYKNQLPLATEIISPDYSVIGKTNAQVLSDAINLYNSSLQSVEKIKNDYIKAKENLDYVTQKEKDLKKAFDRASKELSDLKTKLGITDSTGTGGINTDLDKSILDQKRALEQMEIERQRAVEELNLANVEWQRELESAYFAFVSANDAYMEAFSKYQAGEISQEDFSTYEKSLQDASTAYNNLQSTPPSNVITKQRAIEDLDIKIRNAREDLAAIEKKYQEILNSSSELKTLEDRKEKAELEHNQVTEELEYVKETEEKTKANQEELEKISKGFLKLKLDAEITILNEELDNKKAEKEELESDMGTPVTDEMIESAEKNLKSAQEALAKKKRDDNKSSTVDKMKLDLQKKELDRLQREVDRLQKTTIGTEVKAKVAGMVSDINFVAGQEVDQNAVLAKIQIVDKGYYTEFDVTNEEAARIRPGETASIQYYYWGSDIEAVVESIKNSTSNPGKSKTVRIAISGEIEAGRQLTFNLGERGQNYDTIVPKSAIREDSNGKFILTVVSKSTPLGNRYTAVRADITVLAEDDTNSAISLSLYGNEFIITTSTKPIKDGDQVRLVDR